MRYINRLFIYFLLTYLLLTLSYPRGRVLIPTDPRTEANKGGYDLGVFVWGGGLLGHRRRQ